jgi:Leucine-rich repeat (LRR) protein
LHQPVLVLFITACEEATETFPEVFLFAWKLSLFFFVQLVLCWVLSDVTKHCLVFRCTLPCSSEYCLRQGNLLASLGDVFLHESPSLVSIQLDSNSLVSLHNDSLRGQSSVQIMWLGHNRLTRVDRALFSDLLLIQRVYLTNNSISHIEDRAFEPMQALKFLDLSLNRSVGTGLNL